MDYAVFHTIRSFVFVPVNAGGVICALLVALLAETAQVAWAQTPPPQVIESARLAFDEGRFLDAAEMAESLGTAEALTLACLALVVHGRYVAEEVDKEAYYERGMTLAERAVGIDPDNAESTLRRAQAMGRYAAQIGALKALRQSYLGRIRELLERALALDEQNADAHVGLAAWHAEGVKRGGLMARTMLGASNRVAAVHYERALELAPDSKLVLYQYARGLLLQSARKNRDRALELLVRLQQLPSPTALDRLVDERAAETAAELGG